MGFWKEFFDFNRAVFTQQGEMKFISHSSEPQNPNRVRTRIETEDAIFLEECDFGIFHEKVRTAIIPKSRLQGKKLNEIEWKEVKEDEYADQD